MKEPRPHTGDRRDAIRLWLGGIVQTLATRLLNPYDTWEIEYRQGRSRYGATCKGFYSQARLRARELKGKIIGCRSHTIPAGNPIDDEGEDWKRGSKKP